MKFSRAVYFKASAFDRWFFIKMWETQYHTNKHHKSLHFLAISCQCGWLIYSITHCSNIMHNEHPMYNILHERRYRRLIRAFAPPLSKWGKRNVGIYMVGTFGWMVLYVNEHVHFICYKMETWTSTLGVLNIGIKHQICLKSIEY